jgi:hypothetical protein
MEGLKTAVVIDGREFIVRELAEWEIRQLLQDWAAGQEDFLDSKAFDEAPMSAVRLAAGVPKEEWDRWFWSHKERLLEAAKTVNARFFHLVAKLQEGLQQKP